MASHHPLHTQLKESLLDAIVNGDYTPGTQLPSQRELCRRYDMSHMTVRRAINELVQEGVIYAVPGKGIYVSPQSRMVEYDSLQGFEQQLARFGMEPTSRVLEARLVPASTVLAQLLKMPAGAPLVFFRRLQLANGRPHAVTTAHLPHTLCPGILEQDLLGHSLFATLREVYGLKLAGSDNVVSAQLADEETACLLELTQPASLLVREQITYLDTGQPIEFSRTLTHGETSRLQFKEGVVPE
jgi:GntR family transcriptional regulator